MKEVIIDPQIIIDPKNKEQAQSEERFNKEVEKISRRIANRALHKIKKGNNEFPVKGGLFGCFQTAHTPSVYEAVRENITETGNDIEFEIIPEQHLTSLSLFSGAYTIGGNYGRVRKDSIKVNKINNIEV